MRALIYFCALGILIGLCATALMLHFKPYEFQANQNSTPAQTISESMHGVKAWRFNEQGEKIQSLKMQTWYQYHKDPVIHMRLPELSVLNPNGDNWSLTAISGEGLQTQPGQFKEVKLLQQVVATQKQQDLIQIQLNTEELNYYPGSKLVKTQKPVTVIREDMQLKANEMTASLDEKTIQFNGRVQSTYDKIQ